MLVAGGHKNFLATGANMTFIERRCVLK